MAQRNPTNIAARDEGHECGRTDTEREIQEAQIFCEEVPGKQHPRGALHRVHNQRDSYDQQKSQSAEKSRFIEKLKRLRSL